MGEPSALVPLWKGNSGGTAVGYETLPPTLPQYRCQPEERGTTLAVVDDEDGVDFKLKGCASEYGAEPNSGAATLLSLKQREVELSLWQLDDQRCIPPTRDGF